MRKLLWVVLLSVLVASCTAGGASETVQKSPSGETVEEAYPRPGAATPDPTVLAKPTPPIGGASGMTEQEREELLGTGGSLCHAAFSSSVTEGTPARSALSLVSAEDPEEGWREDRWEYAGLLPFEADAVLDVGTLVCVRSSKEQVGTYTDGSPGYKVWWQVRLVSWPDGAVLGRKLLSGGKPPDRKMADTKGMTGSRPSTEFAQWVLPILSYERVLVTGSSVRSISFSPDGRLLASGGRGTIVRLWEVRTGEELHALSGHESDVNSVQFSPGGEILASAGWDGSVRLWDVETGQVHRVLETEEASEETVQTVAFSPDGRFLASGGTDDRVRLWNVETGEQVRVLRGHEDTVFTVSFSPDGQLLASGSWDRTVKLWDSETGQEVRTLVGHEDAVTGVAFSPDGGLLASGSYDLTVGIWDVETGQEMRVMWGIMPQISSVAFSPDGRFVASGSADEMLTLWEVETGKEVRVLRGHASAVMSVVFSPDGKTLASGSSDHTVRLWVDEVADLLD
jgi:WD40 repeat protein